MSGVNGVSIVLPCLNEAITIAASVAMAHEALYRAHRPGEIIVADNGSQDGSRRLARQAGARVVRVPVRGYGAALRAGFQAARYTYVVMADADLSYPLLEVPRLCAELDAGADFVLGRRRPDAGAMPLLHRYLGTPVLSLALRRLHGISTYDCNSGMRGFRKEHLHKMSLTSDGMELASEMLLRAGQMKLNYREIDIPFYRDGRGGRSHLRPWRDGWRHLRLIVKTARVLPRPET